MSDTMRNEIIALERSYWDAMKAKDGTQTAKLSGEASIVTGARGVMNTQRQNGQDDRGRQLVTELIRVWRH